MNTVLFLSLCWIGLALGAYDAGSTCEDIKGTIRIKRKTIENVESAMMCAITCQPAKKCIFWEYNTKANLCKIGVTRVKPSMARSGINCNLPEGEVFEMSSPILKTKNVEDIESAEMCAYECESKQNCLTWVYGRKGCRITKIKRKENKKTSYGFPTTTPPRPPCEDDWFVSDSGSCYKVMQDYKNWTDARANCSSYGGDLVTIQDSDEWDFVYDVLNNSTGSYVWLGGIFNNTGSGVWEWADGSSFDFTNWVDPNATTDYGNCLETGYGYGPTGWAWESYDCTAFQWFACEI